MTNLLAVDQCARGFLALALVYAGVMKWSNPYDFARTLALLGLPRGVTVSGAVLLSSSEVLLGVLLVTLHSAAPAVLAGCLFLAFAAAGVYSRARRLHILCNCLGGASIHRLGIRQLVALLYWSPLVYLASRHEAASFEVSQVLLTAALMAFAVVQARRLKHLSRELSWDRLAVPSYRQVQL